jgi:hypothetical protein
MDSSKTHWCPSAQPADPQAVVLGVHAGNGTEIVYLDAPVPAKDVLDVVPPGVDPTRVARFAAHCVDDCRHRVGADCGLITKILIAVPTVPRTGQPAPTTGVPAPRAALPACHLRAKCKWFAQEGPTACTRCPLVGTYVTAGDQEREMLADPGVSAGELRGG